MTDIKPNVPLDVPLRVSPQELGLMPQLVIALTVLLIVAGVFWYGVSAATLGRLWSGVLARPSGPMSFRFILQPSVAAIAAVLDGWKDARTGRLPYLWSIARLPGQRIGHLREGLTATARIILIGLTMDLVYQIIVFKAFYPGEALVTAVFLTFVPYVLIRGPATRIVRRGCTS